MQTADKILAAAYEIQELRPNLTPADWKTLGLVAGRGQTGISFVELRKLSKTVGTSRKIYATLDRLVQAKLIDRLHSGGATSPITIVRSDTPIEPII